MPTVYNGWSISCNPTPNTFASCRISLHTHRAAALHEAFEPAEARRILQRVEFHYKRHPWQEARIWPRSRSVYPARGCLSRRVKSMLDLQKPHRHAGVERNTQHCTISWRFTSKASSCHMACSLSCHHKRLTSIHLHASIASEAF